MFRKIIILFILISVNVLAFGQNRKDVSRIFRKSLNSNTRANEIVNDAVFLEINADYLKEFYKTAYQNISISIPLTTKENITLELERFEVMNEDLIIRTSGGDTIKDYQRGICYKGKLSNKPGFATLCIFNNEVSGIVVIEGMGNFNIGKLTDRDNMYIVYNDLNFKSQKPFICQTECPDVEIGKEVDELKYRAGRCVSFYLEGDYELYQSKGSINAVVNYITTLFAEIAILYSNENIKIGISEIKVWDTEDNYSNKAQADLDRLKVNNPSFNGNLASLLSYGGNSEGGLAWVDALCDNSISYSFCGINGSFNNVPTYSWDVMVCAHEWGHNFGSPHTHSCSWNGNNTQIDDCGNVAGENPSCYNPSSPKIPQGGGTIMSYCHLNSVGINLNLGFGPQPGNLIRSRYNTVTCLTECQGIGAPQAAFEANITETCEDQIISFTDLSTFSPKKWQWSFPGGDPDKSTIKNPEIAYNSPGIFEVTLICSNILGSDSLTKKSYIIVNGKDFPLFAYTLSGDKKVVFDNKSKFSESYFWDFGDGAYSFDVSPTHSYENDGLYTVTLYTYNDNCPSDDIYVKDIEIASPTISNFTFNQTDFCTPSSIQFFDASSANTKNRLWEFEGGTPATSTELNPIIVYYDAGTYDVKLTASNSGYSNPKNLNDVIKIFTTPNVNFSYIINADKVSFTDISQNADSLYWDFGDNTFSHDKNPIHIYANNGNYIVRLTATNDCGKEIKEKSFVINKNKTSDLEFQKFNLYPNPNKGNFSLELETQISGLYDFKIYNSTGILIKSVKRSISSGINTSDFYLEERNRQVYTLSGYLREINHFLHYL